MTHFFLALLVLVMGCFNPNKPSIASNSTKEKWLFVGPPRTGKSSLIKSLKKQISSHSDLVEIEPDFLKVTISQDEITGETDSTVGVEALQRALTEEGNYRLFFVITESNGRVGSTPWNLLECVLSSVNINISDYAVVLNQIRANVLKEIKKNPGELKKKIFRTRSPTRLILVQRRDDLEDSDSDIVDDDSNLEDFLAVTKFSIKSKEVMVSFVDFGTKLRNRNIQISKCDEQHLMYERQAERLQQEIRYLEWSQYRLCRLAEMYGCTSCQIM